MASEVKRYPTPVFQASFPEVFTPKSFEGGGEPKYSLSAIWDPSKFTEADKKKWAAIEAAMDEASLARFKKRVKDLPANFKRGIRDGAERADMEGYGEGKVFANLTTKLKPGIVHVDKGEDGKPLPIGPEHGNADLIYPGCYMRATVTVYSYDNKGKGVALGLMNLQYVGKGPRLDSRTDAAEDFDDDVDASWLEQDDDEDPPF